MTAEVTPTIGFARDSREVRYWLELYGCPQCGERSVGTPRYLEFTHFSTGAHMGGYTVTCPTCGHQRSVQFNVLPGYHRPLNSLPRGHLGGPDPSQIISPHLFAKELARCMAEIGPGTPVDVATLARLRGYQFEWKPLSNGQTCSVELAKFLPEGSDAIPETYFVGDEARAYRAEHPEQFTRAYIAGCMAHFEELGRAIAALVAQLESETASPDGIPSRPLPLPPFSLAALKFHERWVEHGDGEERQRMVAVGADARERNLSGRNLSSVSLDKVTLDRANLSNTQLQHAELTDVSARDALWSHAGLVETKLRRGNFSGSDMASALLHHSTIDGCNFSNAQLAHSSFRKAEVTRSMFSGADLTDARLHEAVFTDCDLRGAKLGITPRLDPRITDVTFVRCDLRDTNWRGRELVRLTLVDCKIFGAHGVAGFEDAAMSGVDLSPAGDGSSLANGNAVEEALQTSLPNDERH